MKLGFISESGKLKDIERTGWVLHKVRNPESVADHSFRIALLALVFAKEEKLNAGRCVKMALIHDLTDVYAGDIATRPLERQQVVSDMEKAFLERNAMKRLLSLLPPASRSELQKLWGEYDSNKTKEAGFVHDMDKVEMVLQALEYKSQKRTSKSLDEFFESRKKIKTKTGRKLWEEIRKRYKRLK